MNILLTIIGVIVAIIAIILLVAMFIKKEYTIHRGITIDRSKEDVFNYVKFQKNQDHYSKWVMTDPNAKKNYKGTDGTVGFSYAWDSENKNVGKGEQVIQKIIEGEKIELEIHFIKPFEGIGLTQMTTSPIALDKTKLQWGMEGKNKYPFNLMNLFLDKMLGKDMEESLVNLKKILERQSK